jgi:hypothetical protein
MLPLFPLHRSLDKKGNLFWFKGFPSRKGTVGTSPDLFQNWRYSFTNDVLTDLLMVGFESSKILLIKEMAERAMTDIMQQTGKAEEFFYIGRGREFTFFNSI